MGVLTALPTKATGNKVSLANYNTIKDNFDALIAGIPAWNEVIDTWTWASTDGVTFTATVPTDATTIYAPGMRVRLKQGGAYKYFIITAVAATVITLYGGTD